MIAGSHAQHGIGARDATYIIPTLGDLMAWVRFIEGFGVVVVLCMNACSGSASDAAIGAGDLQLAAPVAQQGEELNLLCGSAAQCSDGQACTIDLCVAGICVHSPDLGCCDDETDCNQDLVCATVTCVLNACIETPILGCGEEPDDSTTDDTSATDAGGGGDLGILCGGDDDCEDGDPCTDDICLLAGGVCLFATNPLCCEQDTDCIGVLACHGGECVSNRCDLSILPECNDAGVDAGSSGESLDASVDDGPPADDSGAGVEDSGGGLLDDIDDSVDDLIDDAVDDLLADDTGDGGNGAPDDGTSETGDVPGADDSTADDSTVNGDDTQANDDGEDQSTSRDDAEDDVTADDSTSDSIDDVEPDDSDDSDETSSSATDGEDEGVTDREPTADDSDDPDDVATTDEDAQDDPDVAPFVAPNTEENAADDDDDAGADDGTPKPAVASGEMTGGACSLAHGPTHASGLEWLGLIVALGCWRRRK